MNAIIARDMDTAYQQEDGIIMQKYSPVDLQGSGIGTDNTAITVELVLARIFGCVR